MLNGVGPEGHEPLLIGKHGTSSEFTKTARKPYDIVVTCILLRAWMLAPNCIEVQYGEPHHDIPEES